jgi:hypothetical protein
MNLLTTSYRRALPFIMGNTDSKLVFKQGIFKLSEVGTIPADDPYWKGVSTPAVEVLI